MPRRQPWSLQGRGGSRRCRRRARRRRCPGRCWARRRPRRRWPPGAGTARLQVGTRPRPSGQGPGSVGRRRGRGRGFGGGSRRAAERSRRRPARRLWHVGRTRERMPTPPAHTQTPQPTFPRPSHLPPELQVRAAVPLAGGRLLARGEAFHARLTSRCGDQVVAVVVVVARVACARGRGPGGGGGQAGWTCMEQGRPHRRDRRLCTGWAQGRRQEEAYA